PVPFKGPLRPGDPVQQRPPQRPLTPELVRELDALYERPAPLGPAPILRSRPSAVYAVGGGDIVRARLDQLPFGDRLPPERRVAVNNMHHYTNNVVRLPRGEVRFAAFDRVLNDTRLSLDSMAFEASFTDEEGNDWRVLQTRIAPISPTPVSEPWFGGVVIDTPYHGLTKLSTEAEPTVLCKMCSWGWANVWKNGKQVAASALLHVMLTTDVRDASKGYAYGCYDCRDRPIDQIHLDIYPQSNLPTENGGLHVMWQSSTYRQGTPDEIARSTPPIAGPGVPSLLINAVPHLRWSDTEIPLRVGQPVRLILTNLDPVSHHMFMMLGPGGVVQVPLPQGEQWTTMLVFNQPGEYEFWCPVKNHRNRGMYGRFIVEGGTPGGTTGPPGERGGGDAPTLVLDMGHDAHHTHSAGGKQ
ncbi:MAG: cupredoxin domain-containing protein, partial [Gemmatimonadota bacterium]|nr:cupredoxin domain-containing protein [Gemmatimonadota bacterium]